MAQELPERRSFLRRFMPLFVAVAFLGVIVFARLQGSDGGVGAQKPTLSIDFPATAEAGSVQTAVLEVSNPGASQIERLFVSFSALAVAGGDDLPTPIVSGGVRPKESAVVDVEPDPTAVGAGVRFGFGPLPAGESRTIEFDLRMPETTGPAANSIAVYDGELPERATGGSLEITVES